MSDSTRANGDEQVPQNGGWDPLGVLYLLAAGHAACLLVFLRRRFGLEAFRRTGPVGFAIIILYGGFTGAYVMWPFLWVYVGMLIVRRIEAFRTMRTDRGRHSRFDGESYVAMRVPLVRSERTAKELIEPFFCLVGGIAVVPWSPALGLFILLGCLSIFLKEAIERCVFEARVQAMRDAAIEQRHLAEAFRSSFDGQ
jgi:hypothetical protein